MSLSEFNLAPEFCNSSAASLLCRWGTFRLSSCRRRLSRSTFPRAVFLQYDQLYLSRATECISHRLISIFMLCLWGTVGLSSAVNESIKHKFCWQLLFGCSSYCVSFSPTSVWKFPNTCILLQSLLLFSAYHLQSQIVYWISNIGLSGSQYAGGGRGRENGAKSLVEMKIGGWRWLLDGKGRLLTGQFDCSQGWWIRQKAPPIPCWTE